MKRKSGVLLSVSSLPSGYSCGSFGKGAYKFVDTLEASGFSVWQVLPFCMVDEYNSPYKSRASFGFNPYFIDLELLAERGYITDAELASAREKSPYLCEYDRLNAERMPLLTLAAERLRENGAECKRLKAFIKAHPELAKAAEFLALSEANGGAPWQTWKTVKCDPVRLFVWQFVQYEFYTQWMKLKEYANSRGIEIIGDLPIYVDLNSADVWADPALFQLDKDNYPTSVAGVPPDDFSEDGQLWGNPLYDWKEMKKDNYAWWKNRVEFMLTLFDGVRIDHFRAIEAYWSVPKTAASAKEGRWIKGPGRALVNVIREAAGDKLIIAEDLGVITDGVKRLLDYSGFPGMRVLQFAFSGDTETPHLPHNYTENCIAYTGTHDNNTLLGYLFEAAPWQRERILNYTSASSELTAACKDIIRMMLRSSARTVIFPIQDLLAYGRDTRMNTPGTPTGNWEYRVAADQIASLNTAEFAYLNELYSRNARRYNKN